MVVKNIVSDQDQLDGTKTSRTKKRLKEKNKKKKRQRSEHTPYWLRTSQEIRKHL